MKKLTRMNLDELAKEMPVVNDSELRNLIGGAFYFDDSGNFVGAQHSSKDKKFMRIAKTNDLLYIIDTIVYMINKFPLEAFPRYKDLYASYKLNKMVSVLKPIGIEVGRHFNGTYLIICNLMDSTLS